MLDELARALNEERRHLHRLYGRKGEGMDEAMVPLNLKAEEVDAMLRIEIDRNHVDRSLEEAHRNGMRDPVEIMMDRTPGPMTFQRVAVFEVPNLPVSWRVVNPLKARRR